MNINKLLGTKYPILQGGMANIADGKFAATLSNLGILGTIGTGGMTPKILRKELEICRTLTDKPFAVNIMMLSEYIDDIVNLLVEYKVPVVTTGAGNPHEYEEVFRENSIKLIPVISAPGFAVRMERLGASAVIAEGTEAGGHIGEMTTMTLIPQVTGQVDMPVIAAGGIGNGKQMAAAEILGAAGVQIGTGFLFTEECPIHEDYKKAIMKASAAKVTVIGHLNGMPIRVLKNNMTRKYKSLEAKGAGLAELEQFTLGALRKAVLDGDIKEGSVMCGYTVGQFDKILPAGDFIAKLVDEYESYKTGR